MTTITLTLASVPDRDGLVAELWCEQQQVGEVSKDSSGDLRVEIYPTVAGDPWRFALEEFVKALHDAASALVTE